MYKFST